VFQDLPKPWARITPFRRDVIEFLEIVGDGTPGAVTPAGGELVHRGDALCVRADDPLVIDPLIGDQQGPGFGLSQDRHRAQVIPFGLVHEPLTVEVQQEAVLAVIEGQLGKQRRLNERDPVGDQVPVEPCLLWSEGAACLDPESKALAPTVGIGPQGNGSTLGVKTLADKLAVALEASASEERRSSQDFSALSSIVSDDRAVYLTLVLQESLGSGTQQ
jgi:hypothetical protein